jgi:hypothetical protein
MFNRMRRRLFHLGLLLLAPVGAAHAQTHKVDAQERVTRAIGVYEWTGELNKPVAARLIPVSIFIDGATQDAGVYLARPVPFVLQTGDVYAVEKAGEPEGTLNVEFAKNIVTRHSAGDDDVVGAWYGYGKFLTQQEEARLEKLKPAAKPSVVVSSLDAPEDDKPHFVRRPETSTTTPAAAGKPASGTGSGPTPGPAPDSADDPDRPTLRHRDPVDETKPKKEKPSGYVTPPNTSLNDDPDRPSLRRGVPEGQAQTPQLSGLPPNLHQAVAVSDPTNRDDHPFTREWEYTGERAKTLAGIEELAQPRLANYIATNKLTPIAAAPKVGPTFSHSRKVAAQAAPLAMNAEQVEGYTLSYGGLPTFLYTVESPLKDGGPVYLTLVVQRLPAGELQVALSSITDATHLDRVPWMRPVDVVDADWTHRASLLFELRAQTSRQFALYRLVSAKAEQTFVTGMIE